jgi:hypothetical protein
MIIGHDKKIGELEAMKEKAFLYKREVYHFQNYRVQGDNITVVTKEKWFDFGAGDELYNFLKQCKEVSEQNVVAAHAPSDLRNPQNNEAIKAIRDILLEDINKVRADPKYVNQAKQVNNNINTLLNAAKLELMYRKM